MNSPLPFRVANDLLLHETPSKFLSRLQLLQLHSLLITSGLQFAAPSAALSLLNLYLSNPATLPQEAAAVFRQVRDPAKWNLMIRHASANAPLKALSLFREIRAAVNGGTDPFICASSIKACNKARAIREGKSVHCHVIRFGLDWNVNVLNSLVSFYMSSADLLSYAVMVFDKMPERTVVSFNTIISGHLRSGNFDASLKFFRGMLNGSFGLIMKPNYVTFVVLISACVEFREGRTGISLHCFCFKTGLDCNSEVSNALIDLYAKLRRIDDAERVLEDMPEKDLISWNSMLWGYANSNDVSCTFSFFTKMRGEGIRIDRVSISCVVSVCEEISVGRMIHGYVKAIGMESDVSVGTSLIDMYAKCREVESARKLFDELPKEDIEHWNAMIHVYIEHGFAQKALELLDQMKVRGLEFDEVTLLGLVMACRDTGQLHRGIIAHSIVEKDAIFKKSVVLGNALIDMYAKCGSLERARAVFDGMPQRDIVSWTSMIVGYAVNGEGKKSLATFEQMRAEKLPPNSVTFVGVLLACDHAGLIDEGIRLYETMSEVYRIEPQIEHCGCIVDMLARGGRIEEARRFVKNMPVAPNALIWRILVSGCRVHGRVDSGLNLVTGLSELDFSSGEFESESADFVASSNMYAEAGRWGDVLDQRSYMADRRAYKAAGKSSLLLPE
ncbi:putative pentatricopeptide repeat-containing protein At3g05240 [Andrographis paniculata]|uniref:putative pentatricopeptide repeat-containing protein At3g05240 n=1 Tax=Andrographis paniculata TaxID=175694 RepID=UPI0021E9706A|nr:putative pentatricopeptide repeat-containing protein At3g05240 [Andrographis paniculata]